MSRFKELREVYEAIRSQALAKKHSKKLPAYTYFLNIDTMCDLLFQKVIELRDIAKWYNFAKELLEAYKNNPYAKLLFNASWLKARTTIALIRALIDNIKKLLKGAKVDNKLLQSINEVEKIVEMFEEGKIEAIAEVEVARKLDELSRIEAELHNFADRLVRFLRNIGLVTYDQIDKKFICRLCGERFDTALDVAYHFAMMHKNLEDDNVRREVLNIIFGRKVESEEEP